MSTPVIELRSGQFLNLENPDPSDITLEDIAHGLSNICRYVGQAKHFYSVAEHAVLVAARLRDTGASIEVQMAGLHHDDAEAFLGDVSSPLKELLGYAYGGLEDHMLWTIVQALGISDRPYLSIHEAALIKAADLWALGAEASLLLPSRGKGHPGWPDDTGFDPAQPFGINVFGSEPRMAERRYLRAHAMLAAS